MPIRIAMPVAHVTGVPDYSPYYFDFTYGEGLEDEAPVFALHEWYDRNDCAGIALRTVPFAPEEADDDLWNLYAFTDGFLSFQDDSLVLRLPRHLLGAAVQQYNSGRQFTQLEPRGPQLSSVVYRFAGTPGLPVEDAIRGLLANAGHPGRSITRVALPGGGSQTLQQYLAASPANLQRVFEAFMLGELELFVRAGDVIGNFRLLPVEIRFLSTGTRPANAAPARPAPPAGRPVNPSYFLYLVRSAANTVDPPGAAGPRVTMLTAFAHVPVDRTRHPFEFFFGNAATIEGAEGNVHQHVDPAAAVPPRPLHVTVPVLNAAGNPIAGRGITFGALGDWHQSVNSANPVTAAPVRWRYYGAAAGDNVAADRGRFITEVRPGQANRLPGGAAFDHLHTPAAGTHVAPVRTYWERYGGIFNAVAEAFEIPCELLVTIACKESTGGWWYDGGVFVNTDEMNVIRMEPIEGVPANIAPGNAQHQAWLTQYATFAPANIYNAAIPVPWAGGSRVHHTQPLTWDQLATLCDRYPAAVRVSPGVMQTLVGTALDSLGWARGMYGDAVLTGLAIQHNGVDLAVDLPPAGRLALFRDWFGVSVDAAGANTNVAANVDRTLSMMKRALHDITAGACYIKQRFNRPGENQVLVTDLDLPTVASGYNDGANALPAAAPGAALSEKWRRLFAMLFYDQDYALKGPKFYNAAVELFNGNPIPQPAVRLWPGGA